MREVLRRYIRPLLAYLAGLDPGPRDRIKTQFRTQAAQLSKAEGHHLGRRSFKFCLKLAPHVQLVPVRLPQPGASGSNLVPKLTGPAADRSWLDQFASRLRLGTYCPL